MTLDLNPPLDLSSRPWTCPCGSGPELAALGLGPLLWACACDSGFVFSATLGLGLWPWARACESGPKRATLDLGLRPWAQACDLLLDLVRTTDDTESRASRTCPAGGLRKSPC